MKERALTNDEVSRREAMGEDECQVYGLGWDVEYLVAENTLAGTKPARQGDTLRMRRFPGRLCRGGTLILTAGRPQQCP
jgi:hypothetical protein